MTRLTALLRVMNPHLDGHADRLDALAASTKALRGDLRALGREAAGLEAQVEPVRRDLARLLALQQSERSTPAELDRLASVMDEARVSAHVRDATLRADLIEYPVPHLIVSNVLPRDVYAAALSVIPDPVFFDAASESIQTMRVPPRLAPVHVIAAWAFLWNVVKGTLTQAIVDRFYTQVITYARTLQASPSTDPDAELRFVAEPGRIVLRRPGSNQPAVGRRPWHWLTVVVNLAGPGDTDAYGSRLALPERAAGPPREPEAQLGAVIPFRGNTALAVFDPGGGLAHEPIPRDVSSDTIRFTYEVAIGLDRQTRRTLLAGMDEPARRAWGTGA